MSDGDDVARAVAEANQAKTDGDVAAAEQALRRALRLQEARVGPGHPDVTGLLNELGVVCHALGRSAEAEFLHRRALGIARRTLAANAPQIAESLEHLEAVYRDQGTPEKFEKAATTAAPRSGLPGIRSRDAVKVDADSEVVAAPDLAEPPPVIVAEPPPVIAAEPPPVIAAEPPPVIAAEPPPVIVAEPPPVAVANDPLAPIRRWWLAVDGNRRRVVVVLAVSALVVAVAWLLFGTRDVPGERIGASRIPASTAATDTSGPGALDASEHSGSAVDAERSDVGVGPNGRETTPSRPSVGADAVGPVSSPASPPGSSSVVLVESGLCRRLFPDGAAGGTPTAWNCVPLADVVSPGAVFFYTRVRAGRDTFVTHRWFHEGRLEREIQLEIVANYGPGYRTYSMRSVRSQQRGVWRVELWSADEDLLLEQEFRVR